MTHIDLANRAGVYIGDLNALVDGKITANVATRLGVASEDAEDFINGSASLTMVKRLGVGRLSAVEELSRTIGRNGAIGVIFGLLISS